MHDGSLYWHSLLCIPNGPPHLEILQVFRDSFVVDHFGISTIELITIKYWSPSLQKSIQAFINSCGTCSQVKAPRHQPHGLLMLGIWSLRMGSGDE